MAVMKSFRCAICDRTTRGHLHDMLCWKCEQNPEEAKVKRNKDLGLVFLFWALVFSIMGYFTDQWGLACVMWIMSIIVFSCFH